MSNAKRLLALTVACALVIPGEAASGQSQDAERAAIEAREAAVFPTQVRTVRGSRGLVAGTASPIAVEAGAEVLREGGSAADAAMTTALTQVTTMLGANVSYAGVAQLVYFEARTGRVYALDAGWGSWRGERSPATIPAADVSLITGGSPTAPAAADPGRKTLVPGFMAGMEAMHRRFGRLRFARLFEPAIQYAEQGVPVTPMLAAYMTMGTTRLRETPAGRRFVLPDGVNLPRGGERFVQRDLAQLLRQVSRQGARPMYRGAWARDYVDTVRAAGGAATLADMRSYAPRWSEPLRVAFRGAEVVGPDRTNTNSCAILEALNLIDHRDVAAPYWQDADALRTLSLAMRVAQWSHFGAAAGAFEQRAGVGGSCEARVAPAYGAAAAPAMETMLGGAAEPAAPGHHSASVVAVDRWGNVAALVHSSNTVMWGDTGLVVDGVPVPTPAGLYQRLLVGLAPGAPVPSDMAPVLMLRDGRPVLAVAAIGSSLVQETVRLVAGLEPALVGPNPIRHTGEGRYPDSPPEVFSGLGPGLRRGDNSTSSSGGIVPDPAEVIGAPPLLLNFEQGEGSLLAREELVPAGRYPPELRARLEASGIRVREVDAQRALILRGTAAVGLIGGSPEMRAGVEVPGVLAFVAAE